MIGCPSASPASRWEKSQDRFERWLLFALVAHGAAYGLSQSLFARELLEPQRAEMPLEAELEIAPPPPPPPEPVSPPGEEGKSGSAEAAAPKPAPKERAPEPPSPTPPPPREWKKQLNTATEDLIAQAMKALTSEDEDAPTVASGEGSELLYGLVAGGGRGTLPTFNTGASLKPIKPRAPRKPQSPSAALGSDRSRRAHVFGGLAQRCKFPMEAEVAGIDQAVASVVVTVGVDGKAQRVVIMNDPGYGFGRAAYRCAFTLQYSAARDRTGRPIVADTLPVNIRFTR